MEDLLPIINFYRQQPMGYWTVGVDYGYNDTYTNATSLNGDKIFKVWAIQCGFDLMMTDFRAFLTEKEMEHDNDDNPVEIYDDKKHADLEYKYKLSLTSVQPIPEFTQPWVKRDDSLSGQYTGYEIIFNNERSVEENQILAQRIYQYGFSNIANIRYGSISMDEFYFATFNSEEELNNMMD
tara:strand:+ start:314 stop:856 length:543 start_codon:yes stop_codon:yes gene_type:complete